MLCGFRHDGRPGSGWLRRPVQYAVLVWVDGWSYSGWLGLPAPCLASSGERMVQFGEDGTAHAPCRVCSGRRTVWFGADGTTRLPAHCAVQVLMGGWSGSRQMALLDCRANRTMQVRVDGLSCSELLGLSVHHAKRIWEDKRSCSAIPTVLSAPNRTVRHGAVHGQSRPP